jgi:hypothetical protein
MSLTVFLGLCILGIDFMIYALFQWTYGDRRSEMARKLAASKNSLKEQAPGPFLVRSENHDVRGKEPRGDRAGGVYGERLA